MTKGAYHFHEDWQQKCRTYTGCVSCMWSCHPPLTRHTAHRYPPYTSPTPNSLTPLAIVVPLPLLLSNVLALRFSQMFRICLNNRAVEINAEFETEQETTTTFITKTINLTSCSTFSEE
jgi:hypothetical protein